MNQSLFVKLARLAIQTPGLPVFSDHGLRESHESILRPLLIRVISEISDPASRTAVFMDRGGIEAGGKEEGTSNLEPPQKNT
jgi:hypothetical protein